MDGYAQVLLIDDDTQVREALGEALAAEDYRVALAASGSEALCRLQEPGRVDAVLLDLMLGEENGWTLFERLTSLAPSLPVILITAARGQRPPDRSGVALMEKPLNLSLLFEILREFTAPAERCAPPGPVAPELMHPTELQPVTSS
jgi:DNA-binding NtrC family response regulator